MRDNDDRKKRILWQPDIFQEISYHQENYIANFTELYRPELVIQQITSCHTNCLFLQFPFTIMQARYPHKENEGEHYVKFPLVYARRLLFLNKKLWQYQGVWRNEIIQVLKYSIYFALQLHHQEHKKTPTNAVLVRNILSILKLLIPYFVILKRFTQRYHQHLYNL